MVDQIKRELNGYLGKIKRLLEKKDAQARKAQSKNIKAAIEIESVLIDDFAVWASSRIDLLSSCIIQDQETIKQILDSKEDALLKRIKQLEAKQGLISPELLALELWARKSVWTAQEIYEYLKSNYALSPGQAHANLTNLANAGGITENEENSYQIRIPETLNEKWNTTK